MEKENKRIKQNKNNRRLHVNRMYLKLFGILFILILLPLVSSVTYVMLIVFTQILLGLIMMMQM